MLFNEIIGIYCENHAKYTNKLRAPNAEILISKKVSRVASRFAVRRTWIRHMLHARIALFTGL